jgi:hypothetical protein
MLIYGHGQLDLDLVLRQDMDETRPWTALTLGEVASFEAKLVNFPFSLLPSHVVFGKRERGNCLYYCRSFGLRNGVLSKFVTCLGMIQIDLLNNCKSNPPWTRTTIALCRFINGVQCSILFPTV